MQKKGFNFFFLGSIGFLILALGFVTLLGRTKSSDTGTDVSAKAGITSTLKMSADVVRVDDNKGSIQVDQLKFLDRGEGQLSLGAWVVTAPPTVSVGSLSQGDHISIIVDPLTFLAQSHTLTATEIRVLK